MFRETCDEAAVYTGISVKELMGIIGDYFVKEIGSEMLDPFKK